MKVCPTCRASYGDEMSFCLQDGSALMARPTADLTNQPTEVLYRPTDISNAETIVDQPRIVPPTQYQAAQSPQQYRMSLVEPSSRMGCALTIGQVAAGLVVVVGLGFVGLFFALRAGREVAMTSISPDYSTANKAPVSSSANASNTVSSSNYYANAAPKSTPQPPNYPTTSSASNGNDNGKVVSGGVVNGKATSLPKPEYPAAAKAVHASGAVNVEVLIDETGKVVSAKALSGHPLLRAAAESAARAAIFSPTMLSGKAVKVSGVIVYNFVPQ